MRRARFSGGLYEGKRGKALRVTGAPENGPTGVRASVTKFLTVRKIVHAITDSGKVESVRGTRRMVYPAGWPDITAILPVTGQLWAIETKTQTGELEESQKDLHPVIEAAGALLTIARSVDDVRCVLNHHLLQFKVEELNAYFARLGQVRDQVARRQFERRAALRKS